MVIRPIPISLLPHTITLIHSLGVDRYGKSLGTDETEINHVRVIPSSSLKRDKYAETINFNYLLIVDAKNSKGDKPFTLVTEDKISWNGITNDMEITKITPCYADKEIPHHWKVELT